MKSENLIQEKSFEFAVRIVKAMQYLRESKNEYVLSQQLLKSGTSIGANIEESIGGVSKPDFLFKMGIAYKEARETIFWIRLLKATGYLDKNESNSLLADAQRLCRIICKIQITTKSEIKSKTANESDSKKQ